MFSSVGIKLILVLLPLQTLAIDCAPDLSSVGDSVISLSDELSDAYTAEERCDELGGYLVVTRENPVERAVTSGAKQKYTSGMERVWIYYNKNQINLYKYSKKPKEALPWFSPQHLGHLWYFDLSTTSTSSAAIPIYFCKARGNTGEKWLVRVGQKCNGWVLMFVLYGRGSPKAGYKAIHAYNEGNVPGTSWSTRLTDVKGDNYKGFNKLRGTFYAPVHESQVFIGARFDIKTQQWKWSDGRVATRFTDVRHTTCQQKVWDYTTRQTSNRDCSGNEAYYSCQIKAKFGMQKVKCNSTLLDISWNLLPLATKYHKTLTVVIQATNTHSRAIRKTVIDKPSVILEGLRPASNYGVIVTLNLGCDNVPKITWRQNVRTGQGKPADVTNGYVIKSDDIVQVKFPNPQPNGSLNFTINIQSKSATLTEVVGQSKDCGKDICQIPLQLSEYTKRGKLNLSVTASNCEGKTAPSLVAGNFIAPNPSKQDCGNLYTGLKEPIAFFSDDLTEFQNAEKACNALGGALASFSQSELNSRIYNTLSDRYLKDIQRIWVYRLKTNKQIFKYSFSITPGDNWEVPKENDHLNHLDLYNRKDDKLNLIYFCKIKDTTLEQWKVGTENCGGNDWQTQFSLYGSLSQDKSSKRIFMFVSITTGSVKLKTTNTTELSFKYLGDFYVPDINIIIAGTHHDNDKCKVSMLHYGNKWETLEKPCSSHEAYYACQVEFKPRLEAVPCNSHQLQVIWEDNMAKLQRKVKHMTITVAVRGKKIPEQRINYSKLSTIIGGLTQRSKHTVAVKAMLGGCIKHSMQTVSSETTSYGLADPVTNARVNQTSNVCTVLMPPDRSGQIKAYRVKAASALNLTYHDYAISKTKSDKELRLNVSMKDHGANQRVKLMIQAFTCEGSNDWEEVEGFCISQQPSQLEGTTGGAIFGTVFGIVVLLTLCIGGFIYFGKKKRIFRKQKKVTLKNEIEPLLTTTTLTEDSPAQIF